MVALSRSLARLSMPVRLGFTILLLAPFAQAGEAAGLSPYFGRWTVSEKRPIFTDRGRMYKTVDIAPCGADFCGVSVSDGRQCGPVLFRFLARNAKAGMLQGHGRWGAEQKNVEIYSGEASDGPPGLELSLGDGYDLGGRSGNMPKFHSTYNRAGAAICKAR